MKDIRNWLFGKALSRSGANSGRPAPPSSHTLRWGPFLLPDSEATQHFLAVGATGSGKTSILLLLIQWIVSRIKPGSDWRLCLNDPKNEFIPRIAAMRPSCPVIVADPFDLRSSYWNMCEDIDEPRVALEVAFTLIPEKNESQPFFSEASRHLLYGVLLSYQQRQLKWKFADVLRATESPKRLRRVLLACPYTHSLVHTYFADKKVLSNVLSTLATKTLAYQHIAAAWETTERSFSIKRWVTESSILILGNAETSRHALDAINRCIKKRMSDELLAQPDSRTRRTFDVTDELSEMGHLPGLVPLAKKGRSKGVSLIIAFQSIAGLRAKDVYGPELTADLLGQFGNRCFSRIECEQTALWASKLVGDQEVIQTTQSWSTGKESTTSRTEHYATRNAVLPSEFMSVPACNYENGLTAWYLNRCQDGVIQAHMNGPQLFGRDLIQPSSKAENLQPRSPKCQLLRPWTKEERELFAPVYRRSSAPKAPERHFEGIDFSDVDNI